MAKSVSIMDRLSSKGKEWIPSPGFHLMTLVMKLMDGIGNHAGKTFSELGVEKGQTVVDYGCGPARYVRLASEAVGSQGLVYAVDIHPVALRKAGRVVKRFHLENVMVTRAEGYDSGIADHTADLVYALDIFHMVENPAAFLGELRRIAKPEGALIIQDGHQTRSETLDKIKASGCWIVDRMTKNHVSCRPKESPAQKAP